jgi:Protein of unknown function (DUF1579)
MKSEPQKEHAWLRKLAGEWTYEGEVAMGPGQPPAKFKGTETVRSLGGLWVVGEAQGEMPGGGSATMIITLGYDPQKKKYVGTWIGSMMTNLWIYDCAMDAAGRVLTMSAEGPSMSDNGKMAKYQDIIEVKSNDHRVLTARVMGDDGSWNEFMTSHYRRVS